MIDAKTLIGSQYIDWINSRRSIGNLVEPMPSKQELLTAINCAASAPDHKNLQPWRFTVISGAQKEQFGQALLESAAEKAKANNETLNDADMEKIRNVLMRTPMIIAVTTQLQEHEKVPEWEQLLSAGAAIQNLILALQALGYSTVWRTGKLINEPKMKAYLEVGEKDSIVAFVYVGTANTELPQRDAIDVSHLVSFK